MSATDDDISAHRVRSNVWPMPHPHDALVQAVEAVYRDVVEDEA